MIYRIDVFARDGGGDPAGQTLLREAKELGYELTHVRAGRIFLIDTSATASQVRKIADELLADPVAETAVIHDGPSHPADQSLVEVHFKPGVMDPVAASTQMAIGDMGIEVKQVRTGRSFTIQPKIQRDKLEQLAWRTLANGVVESVHFEPFFPKEFPQADEREFILTHVPLRDLTAAQLKTFSREKHLFLSEAEMTAAQQYFRQAGREPTDIELETIAQTWSEHCVHKTLKSAVDVREVDENGKVIAERHYGNLIKETLFAATKQLMQKRQSAAAEKKIGPECLSVFVDNAGVIGFDQTDAVCFKVETHNHPSAIEPYGGAATGVGGVIRDVLGTGLAARPIANTDVFCVAYPDYGADGASLPRGVLHPKRILRQIMAGVRDYGNRMGIPTVNGAVYFDDRYLGNPLVFCGCVGLIPRDKIAKQTMSGDLIVVMGGRTGRDGIHGATFSSAELTDTHADEFSHAVQIGNAITEKKVTDVLLQARDRGIFNAVTDCGAGGLSSAVGEMGEKTGAMVELEKVPLKYAGLRYPEIWISEAQERMVLAVPGHKVQELLDLAAGEDVEATVIGVFGTENRELVLRYRAQEVGRLSMTFLHEGIPMPKRRAVVARPSAAERKKTPAQLSTAHWPAFASAASPRDKLLAALAHPNVASKHWIIRQYDHEVQGGSVIKPLIGPAQRGPSDAAVLRPKLHSHRGVVLSCGLSPHVADPYDMAISAIDEAVRNAVAVGADVNNLAVLDNFCWPSVDDERAMGSLVAACEACRDAALAYGVPFISGKDSLHNQFTNQETGQVIRIPNTLLISAMGVIEDTRRCITMDLKHHRHPLFLIAARNGRDLRVLAATHRKMAQAIAGGLAASCHDLSDGGLLAAAAEMCIASNLGLAMVEETFDYQPAFAEKPGQYLLELADPAQLPQLQELLDPVADVISVGVVQYQPKLQVLRQGKVAWELSVEQLTAAWRGTLDW